MTTATEASAELSPSTGDDAYPGADDLGSPSKRSALTLDAPGRVAGHALDLGGELGGDIFEVMTAARMRSISWPSSWPMTWARPRSAARSPSKRSALTLDAPGRVAGHALGAGRRR